MIKQFFALLLLTAISGKLPAQYYYNDIVTNKQVLAELQQFKEQKIKAVKVTSLEEDGSPSEGFFCGKKITKNYTQLEIITQINNTYPSIFTSVFTKDGLLKESTDSSEVAATTSLYSYNDKDQLTRISATTHLAKDDYTDNETDDHLYEYGENGTLKRMLLVKNNTDTTIILFQPDENNNIGIEKNSKTGDLYYYYYDTRKRLTDIVHSYPGKPKLIPDYKFDYNSAGLVTQMVASEKEGAYYYTWLYNYDNGLRTGERCYSKEGKLTGSIQYEYK